MDKKKNLLNEVINILRLVIFKIMIGIKMLVSDFNSLKIRLLKF